MKKKSFRESFPDILNLNEVLETRVKPESWTRRDGSDIGKIIIDGEEFEIFLDPHTYTLEGDEHNFINVGFRKVVNGKASEELALTSKNTSRIIGAIAHAIIDKVSEYDTDAIVFAASDHVEKRMSIYNRVVNRLWMREWVDKEVIKDVPSGGAGKLTVIAHKDRVSPEAIEKIKKLVSK
jgi:hypothetical protein